MKNARVYGSTLIWAVPFLISGIAAPILFSNIANRQVAGHYAGSLFIFSAIWICLLSFWHRYSFIARGFVVTFFFLTLLFWSWRFNSEKSLDKSWLLSIRGDLWHHGLTALYFGCLGVLVFHEFRRESRRKSPACDSK